MEFVLTGEIGTTPAGLEKQEWKHRECNFKFWQTRNNNSKTWHTEIWKKKIQVLSNLKASLGANHISIVTRMKFLLSKRENHHSLSSPVKGMGFYPFEEEIDMHIHEAIASVLIVLCIYKRMVMCKHRLH